MANVEPEQEALRAALFENELTAEQATDLHAALRRRRAMIIAAREAGIARPEDLEELQTIDEHLRVLAEEAIIAEFIEDALDATIQRQRMLDQAGERLEPEN